MRSDSKRGLFWTKTDRRDAQILSEVSCRIDLPSVHIPSTPSRERKTLCGMREALVQSRTKLINTVRGWLRCTALQLRTGAPERFPDRVREAVKTMPSYVERQLEMIDSLTVQIAAADKELRKLAKSDSTCSRLMSVPGVGPVTAVRFVAALDTAERFASAHKVEAYSNWSTLSVGSHETRIKYLTSTCSRTLEPRHPFALTTLRQWPQRPQRGPFPP